MVVLDWCQGLGTFIMFGFKEFTLMVSKFFYFQPLLADLIGIFTVKWAQPCKYLQRYANQFA